MKSEARRGLDNGVKVSEHKHGISLGSTFTRSQVSHWHQREGFSTLPHSPPCCTVPSSPLVQQIHFTFTAKTCLDMSQMSTRAWGRYWKFGYDVANIQTWTHTLHVDFLPAFFFLNVSLIRVWSIHPSVKLQLPCTQRKQEGCRVNMR